MGDGVEVHFVRVDDIHVNGDGGLINHIPEIGSELDFCAEALFGIDDERSALSIIAL